MCSLCLSCLQASFNNWLLPGKTLLLWNPPRRLQSIANGSASAAGSHRFPWCGGWFWLLPFVWKSWDPTVCGGTKQKENDENIQEAILCLFFQGFWGQLDRPLVLFSGCVDSKCRCPDAQARSFDVFKASIPATSDHSWPLNFWHFRNSHLKLFSELTWTGMIPSFFFTWKHYSVDMCRASLLCESMLEAKGRGRGRPRLGKAVTDVLWVYECCSCDSCCCSCSFSRSSSLLRCFARRLRDQLRKSHSQQSQSFAISLSQLATLGILVAGPI